jgi:hypothetical protein
MAGREIPEHKKKMQMEADSKDILGICFSTLQHLQLGAAPNDSSSTLVFLGALQHKVP